MIQKSDHIHFDKSMVAGVVVLYNPGNDILDNINSYLEQIEYLFIVDNSDKENFFIKSNLGSGKIEYIFNNSNLGVAAAINIAAKKAIQQNFAFLLTIDQDSKAPPDMIDSLLKDVQDKEHIGIITPLHSNRYGTHLKNQESIQEVIITMTSGNLLSLEAYEKLGEFCEEFFIDYVDIEYCFRLFLNKYKIYRLNNVILEHNEADLTAKKLFNKTFYPHNHKPFRLYYKTRNLLYLRKMYKHVIPNLLKVEYDAYLRTIMKILLFEKQKALKVKMIIIGFWDYLRNKKGRKF